MVPNIQGFHNPDVPDSTYEKNLSAGRFIGLKPEQAENTIVFTSQREHTGAALAEKLNTAIATGQSVQELLSADSQTLAATDTDFTLHGRAATVISPLSKLVAGQAVRDRWLDPQGLCFLWCPPGRFTMGCAEFSDTLA